ncbi:hypothetical protein HYY72_00900 [Candidatus Woesearchaeota archaeon]|nr:hypothetical protein [Candidatus Woesearchaeota archaeon]
MDSLTELEMCIIRVLRPPLTTIEQSGILGNFMMSLDGRSYSSAYPASADQIATLVRDGIEQVVDAMARLMEQGKIRDYKLPDGSLVYTRSA